MTIISGKDYEVEKSGYGGWKISYTKCTLPAPAKSDAKIPELSSSLKASLTALFSAAFAANYWVKACSWANLSYLQCALTHFDFKIRSV